jgi:predicted transcriptional regulator
MNINTSPRPHQSRDSPEVSELAGGQAESGNIETSADSVAASMRRLSEAPNREIDRLINQLQNLRMQLQNAGNRIERDIAEYAELSHRVAQLTAIISDSVRKLPPSIHR